MLRREVLGLIALAPLARPSRLEAQPARSQPSRSEPHRSPPSRSQPSGAERLLLARWPRLSLPFIDLGGLPTPLEPAEGLSRALGVELRIKRDDLAGVHFGGSKARKLELFLGAARAEGHRAVVTSGARGSNQALALAVHARRLGMHASLLLLPQPDDGRAQERLRLERALGANVIAARRSDLESEAAQIARAGERAYVIPLGGTSALGNAGYVEAGLELAAQLDEPSAIYIAAGTTGAAAGLFVGLRAGGSRGRVIAVRTSSRASASARRLREEASVTIAFLRSRDPSFPAIAIDEGLVLEDRFAGPGYARPSEAGARAMRLAAEHGLALDATYTAKAFAALIATSPRRERAVFVHTWDSRAIEV